MMNYAVLVGRLTKGIKKNDEGNYIITLAVPRAGKNEEGITEVDIIDCELWGSLGNNAEEFLEKGSLVGIKGRIQTSENGFKIIAEKVTYLSQKKEEE